MNKQQRDYTAGRINSIAHQKAVACECEKPSLSKHMRRAITAGVAKLKSAKEITAYFESKIIDGDGYRSTAAEMTDLYEAPQSYKDAVAELKAEQDKHAAENDVTKAYAQSLIDRIELGEFEDGKAPILLMESYTPKAAKIKGR